MSFEEDLPEWFRRKHRFFEDIDRIFAEIERMMKEEFEAFLSQTSEGGGEEHKLVGDISDDGKPSIYSYRIEVKPDGRVEVYESRDIKPTDIKPVVEDDQEPFVDIIETNDEIYVIAELPGVEEEGIEVYGEGETLIISADTLDGRYRREVKLPVKADIDRAKTRYKNGVIEIRIPKSIREK